MTERDSTDADLKIRQDHEVIGLVPAAGKGKRIAPLPCSKELYPIGFGHIEGKAEPQPKVVSQYLLEKFRKAGITKAYIVLREGKWDIPAYFGDGSIVDLNLAYVVITDSCGPPDTLDQAYRFVADKVVAFGFPDILFTPDDVFVQLLRRHHKTNADLVLGLYPAHDHRAMDMVRVEATGRVTELVLKPAQTDLHHAWVCAVWGPTFTQFLHDFVPSDEARQCRRQKENPIDPQGDLPVGAVIQAAIRKGLRVEGVTFPTGTYIDIGTPEDLAKALRIYR
jgi:glucose-1-phosphate thymidylyltransferase